MLLGREPALWIGAFRAVVYAGVLFGLDLSDLQITGLVIAVEAVLALLTRTEVTPNVSVVERKTNTGTIVAGPANEAVKEGVPIREHGDMLANPEDEPPLF